MNAIQIADYLDFDASLTGTCTEAALMLRKQHEAIVKLREALQDPGFALDTDHNLLTAMAVARKVIADTEEFVK